MISMLNIQVVECLGRLSRAEKAARRSLLHRTRIIIAAAMSRYQSTAPLT